MANVVFKRGLHANLPAANAATDGVFYLTEDTNRLYVGQGTKLVELNKSIEIVNSIDELPTIGVEVGQFYYVKGSGTTTADNTHNGNILAVVVEKNPVRWVQVNPDTNTDTGYNYNSSLSIGNNGVGTVDTTNNQVSYTVTLGATHRNPNGSTSTPTESNVSATFYVKSSDLAQIMPNAAVAVGCSVVSGNSTTINTSGTGSSGAGFTVTGGDNVTLSGDTANALTISAKDTTYTLGSAANSTAVTLTPNTGSSTSVTFEAGTNMSVSGATAGKISYSHAAVTRTDPAATTATASEGTTITVVDGVTTDAQGHVTAVATKTITAKDTTYTADSIDADSSGNLSFGIKASPSGTTSTKTASGVLYNTITVNGTQSTVYNQGDLGSFYSAAKVDELIAGLNAMTYKGTVGGSNATVAQLPTANVSLGDTYMVGEAGAGVQGSRAGDLLIAVGEEGSDGYITAATLDWTLVPAGNDPDTTYTFSVASDGTISATPSTNSNSHVTVAKVTGTSPITATVSGSTITLSHDNSGVTAGTKGDNSAITAALGYSGTFVVPKVTVDAKGHVTGLTEQTLTLPASDDTTYSISAVQNTTTNKANIRLTPSSGSATNAVVVGDGTSISAAVVSNELKISHEDLLSSGTAGTAYGVSASTTPAAGTGKIKVPNVTVNAQGHVTTITEQEITLPADTKFQLRPTSVSVATANDVDTATVTLNMSDTTAANSNATTATIKITSESLTVSKPSGTTDTVKVEIEWGSF